MERWIHSTVASVFAWAGNIYDLLIITYVYNDLSKCLGVNTEIGTLLFALGLIFRVIGGYTFGKVADIKGRKIVLNIGTAGYASFQALMAFSPNAFVLLFARAMQGLFMGAQWTAGTVIAYENAPPSMKGLINGIVQAGYGLGYALTGVAYLYLYDNWRLFLLTGALPLILIPYIVAKVSDVTKFAEKRNKVKIKPYASVIIRSTIVISGMFFSYYSIFAVYPEFLSSLGISESLVGILMTVSNIALGISFIVFGRISDNISKRSLIMGGVIGEMVGLPLMLGVVNGYVGLGLIIYTISTGFWPLAPLLIVESVPIEIRGAMTGLTYNLGSIIGGIGSILMGYLVSIYGIRSTTQWGLIMGYASLLIVFLTLLTWHRAGNKVKSNL
ncbi:MFS transporter [Stygiolobus caldivivus]|uniref:MFS transporter n=1 Tax=Stygiolobus caldivivus TaxID=2824673 RepID=A0A8D5U788_9CREN|nr:MFS transporter [Stygiolobus caldivivus]BCU70253.1 MFS transporter [Stygiolobus caldivivus]